MFLQSNTRELEQQGRYHSAGGSSLTLLLGRKKIGGGKCLLFTYVRSTSVFVPSRLQFAAIGMKGWFIKRELVPSKLECNSKRIHLRGRTHWCKLCYTQLAYTSMKEQEDQIIRNTSDEKRRERERKKKTFFFPDSFTRSRKQIIPMKYCCCLQIEEKRNRKGEE